MNDTGGKQQPSKAPITYQGFLVDTTTLSSAFLIQCEIPKKMPEQSHAWIGKRCISIRRLHFKMTKNEIVFGKKKESHA